MSGYIAIGNDELGNKLRDKAVCPHCGELHKIIDSKPMPILQAVHCTKDKETYIVGIYRREILK